MLAATLAVAALCGGIAPLPAVAAATSDSLASLYAGGKTWEAFFEAARARKETWRDNYDHGEPDPAMVARGRAVGGTWRFLVVAEDWCGDSANTVPYLVRWAEQVPGVEVRIVNSTVGRWLMSRHKTADGREATPTIVLLDETGVERGCFVERPAPLRAWVAENKPKLADDQFQADKMKWYKTDRGQATVAEFVGLLEAAKSGSGGCPSS